MYILVQLSSQSAKALRQRALVRGSSVSVLGGFILEKWLTGELVRCDYPTSPFLLGVGSTEKQASYLQSPPAALDIAALSKKSDRSFLKPVITACGSVGKPVGPLLVRGG